ncbi:MAG: hypothetical protein II920_01375 [Clostridia bacterium]|nr:hypothetical protein [Clostridia bacterium]
MKKIAAALLIAALLLASAVAEDAVLNGWIDKYNAEAEKYSAVTLDAAQFEMIEEFELPGMFIDDVLMVTVSVEDDGALSVFALQSLPGDERVLPILCCALCCSDSSVSYEKAEEFFSGILAKLNKDGDTAYEMLDGWYALGGYAIEDGEAGVAVAFGYMGAQADNGGESDDRNDTLPNIWEGLEPDGGENGEGNKPAETPAATPAPQKGRYKA